jgi:hypothetical protein
MNMLSTIYTALLAVLISAQGSMAEEVIWPVKGDVDLSSTFCDFRPLHFHGGIDIRTDKKEGREVYSPIDGYVWRIKYSYIGYGKGIYLKDNQGFFYVFGHLSRLSDRFEEFVTQKQYSSLQYYMDETLSAEVLPVKKGELIGYSGQTGYGPPHIHFEKRTPDNKPLNPLTNDFNLDDEVSPIFEGLGVIYFDSVSLFPNGRRRHYETPQFNHRENRYELDRALFVQGPVGFLIDVSDRIRPQGPKLNIYGARLYIDGYLYYEVEYETYDYNQTIMVDLSYDYGLTVTDKAYWHLLFNPPGKNFSGAVSRYRQGGIFSGQTHHSYGLHHGRIEIYDASMNTSELKFDFFYAPTGYLYDIKSESDSVFYLQAQDEVRYLDVENINVLGYGDFGRWENLAAENIEKMGDWYRVSIPRETRKYRLLKIVVNGKSGWNLTDRYYYIGNASNSKYSFNYEFTGGGILFNISSRRDYGTTPQVDIVYEDGYVKSLVPKTIQPNRYAVFYKDTRIKSKIVKIELRSVDDNTPLASVKTNIIMVGNSPNPQTLGGVGTLNVKYNNDCFYSPLFIETKNEKKSFPYPRNTISGVYTVQPITAPLAGDIILSFALPDDVDKTKLGVYRLNSKNEWKWLRSSIKGNTIEAKSSLTGTFAVLIDLGAPKIKNIWPPDGKTVFTPNPPIRCELTDGLAQIENDENIEIRLDGRWLIPEYDPETDILKTKSDRPLKKGRHNLVFKVSDRTGNTRIINSHFFVGEKKKGKK